MQEPDVIELAKLNPKEVPEEFKVNYYFDFEQHPFAHQALLLNPKINSVVAVLERIDGYARDWLKQTIRQKDGGKRLRKLNQDDLKDSSFGWFSVLLEEGAVFEPGFVRGGATEKEAHVLYLERDAHLFGANIFLNEGDIYVGEGTTIEPNVGIKGPAIIGKKNDIRQGAYFRGDVITGDGCTFRGELKNVVMMNASNFPHPSYAGDSICGYKTHFGNQATTANLGIYAIVLGKENIKIKLNGKTYDLGRSKIGIILGDYSQVGCNSVSDPGTFLAPYTIVYQLSRINKGFYGPSEILKNKPLEKGVIEKVPFKM
ncbi:MAG: hypothetical protein L6437_14750 [Kiritimatiellae bacterium]|nr:hypothetical protein [Kiritimatiellia bacterium]